MAFNVHEIISSSILYFCQSFKIPIFWPRHSLEIAVLQVTSWAIFAFSLRIDRKVALLLVNAEFCCHCSVLHSLLRMLCLSWMNFDMKVIYNFILNRSLWSKKEFSVLFEGFFIVFKDQTLLISLSFSMGVHPRSGPSANEEISILPYIEWKSSLS